MLTEVRVLTEPGLGGGPGGGAFAFGFSKSGPGGTGNASATASSIASNSRLSAGLSSFVASIASAGLPAALYGCGLSTMVARLDASTRECLSPMRHVDA